jgi:hypothetical protein
LVDLKGRKLIVHLGSYSSDNNKACNEAKKDNTDEISALQICSFEFSVGGCNGKG